MKRRSSTEASEKDQAKRVSDLFVCKGVPDHIRSDNGKPRDELRQRQAFDTLLEANGALSNGGSSTPARSDRTVPWAIGPAWLTTRLVPSWGQRQRAKS